MTIKIEYNVPEADVLEIRFIRGKNIIHNIFYDISGLADTDVLELKKEAVAKFCAVFPDIPLKSVLQGFKAVDPSMTEYKQTFPHGGWRGGGRPKGAKGTKKNEKTEALNQRITLEEKEILIKILKSLRSGEQNIANFEKILQKNKEG